MFWFPDEEHVDLSDVRHKLHILVYSTQPALFFPAVPEAVPPSASAAFLSSALAFFFSAAFSRFPSWTSRNLVAMEKWSPLRSAEYAIGAVSSRGRTARIKWGSDQWLRVIQQRFHGVLYIYLFLLPPSKPSFQCNQGISSEGQVQLWRCRNPCCSRTRRA